MVKFESMAEFLGGCLIYEFDSITITKILTEKDQISDSKIFVLAFHCNKVKEMHTK